MHYLEARQRLQKLFDSKQYEKLIQQRRRHVHRNLIHTCSNGTQLYLSYPGLKARRKNRKIIYDYRVDLVSSQFSAALSHINLIVDIYNKCLRGFDYKLMENLLIKSAVEGQININQYSQVKNYSCSTINHSIQRIATDAHTALGKSYNSTANQSDLTFEELFSSIFWIVLQEDINYPMPTYQGRKMPFSRYLEALHCFGSNHTLQEVIRRTLIEGYPPNDWSDMNYSFRRFIN